MEFYIKKYFWVVSALIVVLCATCAAQTVNAIVESKVVIPKLAALEEEQRKLRVPAQTQTPVDALPSKDAKIVAERNIFCSTCVIGEPGPGPAGPASNEPIPTTLPLALLATHIGKNSLWSSATIRNTQTEKAGRYLLGDDIPIAGPVVEIHTRYVDFRNTLSNRLERIVLFGESLAPAIASSGPPMLSPIVAVPSETDLLDKGIRKVNDNSYEIEQALIDQVLKDPVSFIRGARVLPVAASKDKPGGVRLYGVRGNSGLSKIGLQNGDTIQSINGFELSSMDKMIEVYSKLKTASNLNIVLARRGKPLTLDYAIK